ncbi:hypothetical protein GBA65_03065 [Rubrobacter marinus]|uniref:Uncharacterized protein n=1 Tax=Rubrobacter marinus TaxID=2653852 RepID=A0A6G8PUT6_9ACTN|nr:hypothetical protein [Rubrobacter marinus]QIN77655.1 hypothetical protein GBA65_03065 [Rubrobacter marinus]
MLAEKRVLSIEELEAQTAIELPEREMLALVNVRIDDVVIQVPIGIAANLCNINAAVLAAQLVAGQEAECEAEVDQDL